MFEREKELVENFLEMLDNTHGYDSDIYQDIQEIQENEEHLSIYTITEMMNYLDNTHCYDTILYKELQKYKKEKSC